MGQGTLATGLTYDSDAMRAAATVLKDRGDALVKLADRARAAHGVDTTEADPAEDQPQGTPTGSKTVGTDMGNSAWGDKAAPIFGDAITSLTATFVKFDSEVRALGETLVKKGDALDTLATDLERQEEENAAKIAQAEQNIRSQGLTPTTATSPDTSADTSAEPFKKGSDYLTEKSGKAINDLLLPGGDAPST